MRDYGRTRLVIGTTVKELDYDDVLAFDGSTLDQDQYDQTNYGSYLRALYRFSPGFDVFAAAGTEFKDFWTDRPGGSTGDQWGSKIKAGVDWQFSPLLRARLTAGYGRKDFVDDTVTPVESALWLGELEWLATTYLTVRFKAGQELETTTAAGATARVDLKFGTSGEYEVWRNLVVTFNGELIQSDYQGIDRVDTSWSAGIGAEYFIDRNIKLTAGYEHRARMSTVETLNDADNIYTVGLKFSF